MDVLSKALALKNSSLTLDDLLLHSKILEQQSCFIIQESTCPNFSLLQSKTVVEIEKKIEELKNSCEQRWDSLNELQKTLMGYKVIKKPSQFPKSTQILLYEKEILTQQIANYREDFSDVSFIKDTTTGRLKAEKVLSSGISGHRQLITEMKAQSAILDCKLNLCERDFVDLQEIGYSLETKIKEKKEAIAATPRSEVEKKKQNALKDLEARVKKLTKILYRLVDKHHPAKSLQSSVASYFSKADISIPSLKSILEILIKKSIENPNQYHQLPWGIGPGRNASEDLFRQAWGPYLNVLFLAYLIQFHPSDPSQVRLVNYQTFDE